MSQEKEKESLTMTAPLTSVRTSLEGITMKAHQLLNKSSNKEADRQSMHMPRE
jgi:hypothetical protein